MTLLAKSDILVDMNVETIQKYNFIKFTPGQYHRGDTKIALQATGLLRLSAGFCRTTGATNFRYAILYFDSSKKAIGIKFTNATEVGTLRVTKDKNGASIYAKSFLMANGLDINNHTGRYDWKKEFIPDLGEIYILKLAKK